VTTRAADQPEPPSTATSTAPSSADGDTTASTDTAPGSSGAANTQSPAARAKRSGQGGSDRSTRGKPGPEGLPIRMLNDRILVRIESPEGERRSSGGILIPATAQVGKRLAWAKVVAVGPNVRAMQQGDKVLFNPEDRYEVEVRGEDYIILRERDIHAVAAERLEESAPGLYI
jgi:chaperonin GroES